MFLGTREHLNLGCAAVIFSCWDLPSGRVCKCWARAETKHSTSFQRWWPFLFPHSLTHLPPLIRYLLVPFSWGGEGDSLGNFSPPPSPLSSFTPMSHQLIPTPLSPLSNSKLATTHMGYADRALTHSNIRPSGRSVMAFQQGIETFRSNCLYVLKLFQRVSWCKLYFSINRDLFGTRSLHWRSLHIQRYKSIPLLKPNWFFSGKIFMIMFSRTVSQMCL